MTTQEKNEYYRQNMVIVQRGGFSKYSKCTIKRCTAKTNFLVFLGGDTKISTIYGSCCNKHLPTIVNRAAQEGLERAEKWIKRAESKIVQTV